ncbi:MAG TPA: putative 2OG-Fe(II) oxygenase [Pseudolabrys sp.]|nr:putative 2OG-Fe(II) oxygenase [Pseudolabrys sp.]
MRWIDQGDPATEERRLELARRAAALDPGNLRCQRALFRSLRTAGAFDELRRRLEDALGRFPGNAELRLELARALIDSGRFEAALDAVERAIAADSGCAAAHRLRYRALMLLRRPEEAAAARQAPAGDPPQFAEADALALFGGARYGELVALCDAHLARQCGHTAATYWKAMALARAGRGGDARAIMSLDRFVAVTTVPAGDAGAADFRAELAREIARNPTLAVDLRGKATRAGLQTRRLRRADAAAVEKLLVLLKDAVDAYVRRLPEAADGFVRACPACASLSAWAVVSGAEGHQVSHFHAGGWLSGVYYVEAPRGRDGFLGSLVLGGVEGGEPPWGTREIEPVPGRLVLFPSYVPHATRPPGIDGRRIIVAFDVVPRRGAARRACPASPDRSRAGS